MIRAKPKHDAPIPLWVLAETRMKRVLVGSLSPR